MSDSKEQFKESKNEDNSGNLSDNNDEKTFSINFPTIPEYIEPLKKPEIEINIPKRVIEGDFKIPDKEEIEFPVIDIIESSAKQPEIKITQIKAKMIRPEPLSDLKKTNFSKKLHADTSYFSLN